MAGESHSIVEYFAEHESYRCGYCGASDTNYSHGMWAHMMTCQDYQDLLNRGWRRSGKYTYKPTMDMLCCPMYTIRCEALDFTLRKSHKKVIKRVNKYLIEGVKPKGGSVDPAETCGSVPEPSRLPSQDNCPTTDTVVETGTSSSLAAQSEDASSNTEQQETSQAPVSEPIPMDPATSQERGIAKTTKPGLGADPNKPRCKKAKELRREKKLAKLAAKGVQPEPCSSKQAADKKQTEGKSLLEMLSEPDRAEKCAHKLEIRTVRSHPRSQEFVDSLTESHNVYHRYQMAIHKDPADKPTLKQFTRFLVDSPLEEEYEEGGLPMGYGSFHQQYILDGKIICVGVIDILPSLISSKYLYYDPEYDFLSLGTYSALREMSFVQELHKHSEKMLYYYMGFYIHSCPKMKYKGQFQPSYLLCPETYTWHPVEKCQPMLDKWTYCRFADKETEDENGYINLDNVLVLYQRAMMSYRQYKMLKNNKNTNEATVKQYAGFVGKICAERMLLYRNN